MRSFFRRFYALHYLMRGTWGVAWEGRVPRIDFAAPDCDGVSLLSIRHDTKVAFMHAKGARPRNGCPSTRPTIILSA